MFRTLAKNWWLLATASLLDALYAGMSFFMQRPDGWWTIRSTIQGRTLVNLGLVLLLAGAMTAAGGLWSSGKAKSWLLVFNGFACATLGWCFAFWKGPLAFRTVAVLIIAMAVSIGFYELAAGQTLRNPASGESFHRLAAAISGGFALGFLAFMLGWLKLRPGSPAQSLFWLGSYFAFSAVCLFWLALRPGSPRTA